MGGIIVVVMLLLCGWSKIVLRGGGASSLIVCWKDGRGKKETATMRIEIEIILKKSKSNNEITSRNGGLTTRRLRWQRRCPRKEGWYRPIIFFLKQQRTATTPSTLLVILSPPLGGMESITAGAAIVHVFIRRMVVGRGRCSKGRRWCCCCYISASEATFAPPVGVGKRNWWDHFHYYFYAIIQRSRGLPTTFVK